MRLASVTALLVMVILQSGCSTSTSAEANGIAIRGKAQYDTRPAQGLILLLHGTGAELPPRAIVQTDGAFEIPASGGVPEGTFKVTVESLAASDENGQSTSTTTDEYRRQDTTPLKITVKRSADGSCDVGMLVIKKRGTNR
jgi:hypothetical protein